jgi:type IV secretory pathway protease TraF
VFDCEIEVRGGASAQANVEYHRPDEPGSETRSTTPISNGRLVFAVPPGATNADGLRGFVIAGPANGMYLVKSCAISAVSQ